MIFSIVITIAALGIMVCLHELGHMVVAKCFGVQVNEFSVGMGPKLFSFKPGETTYSLRLLPLGGYVQMDRENGDAEDAQTADMSRTFRGLKPWKRFIVLAAGATINIILGLIMFAVINKCTYVQPPVVTEITDGYEEISVFKAGDEILKIGGTRIHTFQDLTMELAGQDVQSAERLDVTVRRDGKKLKLNAPLYPTEDGKKLMLVFGDIQRSPNIITSLRYACYDTVYVVKAVIQALGDLITGRQPVDSLSGPVEIVTVVDDMASTGSPYTWLNLLSLFALITVNLGVFNLLPIPALDGGQILFLLIEKITGKEIKPQVVGVINAIFFTLLMVLAAYVTVGDVMGLMK